MPRRYAVTYSDFIWTSQINGANRNDGSVSLLFHSCFVAALSILRISVIALQSSNSKFEFEAIPVESSRPLGLMRPPRAAERHQTVDTQFIMRPSPTSILRTTKIILPEKVSSTVVA
jgi:hypothetical protein